MKDKIIQIHNELSDKNFIWFPFIFLKPRPEVKITQARILAMTLCFSLYAVLALAIRSYLQGSFSAEMFTMPLIYSCLAFFFWFQTVTSTLWNIRAHALSRGRR